MNKALLTTTPFLGAVLITGAMAIFPPKIVTTSPSYSSNDLVVKIDQALEGMKQSETIKPIAPDNSSEFWSSVTNTYTWLKAQSNRDRYIFLFSAVEASGIKNIKERKEALNTWLKIENERFKQNPFSVGRERQWNRFVADISQKIQSLPQDVPARSTSKISKSNKLVLSNLQEIRSELLMENKSILKSEVVTEKNSSGVILLLGLLGSIMALISGRNSKRALQKEVVNDKPDLSVNDKIKIFDLVTNTNPASTVDLDEVCRQRVDKLQYLFNVSGLRIYNNVGSPTTHRLNANGEKIASAVDSLIRGALVLAQNQPDENVSMKWSCQTNKERASIDIEIAGKEFNLEDLRRNHHLLDGGSVLAQWARAEKHLENYRPAIQVIPEGNRTLVTLSLEIQPGPPAFIQVNN